MKSKLLNKEITNIIAAYLYNHTPTPLPKTDTEATSAPNPVSSHPGYKNITRPLDAFLRSYFNTHKYLGGT
jgi:hypothetical protein